MNIVCLTGAGISAESGIRTFRASDGLWEAHRIEDVATPEGFAANPDLVYQFYNQRRAQLRQPDIQPNAAHTALAALAKSDKHHLTLVTQNVDDLHERGGSPNVLHMHGELLRARCVKSGKSIPWTDNFDANTPCTCCQPPQALRPDIVWFGEMPFLMSEIESALSQADIFMSIGTSGNVYPAAGFVAQAKHYGAKTVQLNLEASAVNNDFDELIYGKASEIVPDYIQTLL